MPTIYLARCQDDANDANCCISCVTTRSKITSKNNLSVHPPPPACAEFTCTFHGPPPPDPLNYSLRSPSTTQLAPSTKAGFRNMFDLKNQGLNNDSTIIHSFSAGKIHTGQLSSGTKKTPIHKYQGLSRSPYFNTHIGMFIFMPQYSSTTPQCKFTLGRCTERSRPRGPPGRVEDGRPDDARHAVHGHL